MYGPTPRSTIDRLESPPPEKIFRSPKNWFDERNDSSLNVSIPGTGKAASIRKAIKAPRVKRIRLRSVASFNTSPSFVKRVFINQYY